MTEQEQRRWWAVPDQYGWHIEDASGARVAGKVLTEMFVDNLNVLESRAAAWVVWADRLVASTHTDQHGHSGSFKPLGCSWEPCVSYAALKGEQ